MVEYSPDPIKNGTILDGVSANMFVSIYEALNDTNREKMDKMQFNQAVDIAWKLIAK
jgi:hypothetical protein